MLAELKIQQIRISFHITFFMVSRFCPGKSLKSQGKVMEKSCELHNHIVWSDRVVNSINIMIFLGSLGWARLQLRVLLRKKELGFVTISPTKSILSLWQWLLHTVHVSITCHHHLKPCNLWSHFYFFFLLQYYNP